MSQDFILRQVKQYWSKYLSVLHSDNILALHQGDASFLRQLHFNTKGNSDFFCRSLMAHLDKSNKVSDNEVSDVGFSIVRNNLSPELLNQISSDLSHSNCALTNSLENRQYTASNLMLNSHVGVGQNVVNIYDHRHGWHQQLQSPLIYNINSVLSKIHEKICRIMFCTDGSSATPTLTFVGLSIANGRPSNTYYARELNSSMYHVDYHGTSFLKCFIPLTDMNEENGTHIYVPYSHKIKPDQYLDKRYTDEEIFSIYSKSPRPFNLRLTDYLIEDTSGFHAGVPASNENATRVIIIPIYQKGLLVYS